MIEETPFQVGSGARAFQRPGKTATKARERDGPSALQGFITLHWRAMDERRIREERARVEAECRRVLKSSVQFEKRIRDRWRDKNREKNRRISELEQQVADLRRRLYEEG